MVSDIEPNSPGLWVALGGIILTVSVFGVAQGLSYPLLTFILQRHEVPPTLIGLSAAMTPLGIIASAPFIPPLCRRAGAGSIALVCAALSTILFAVVGWSQNLAIWFPLRFLLGATIGPLYVLSETWVITLAPARYRGRIMGAYAMIIAAGFASGPLCLLLVGSEGWPPFLVGMSAFALCTLILVGTLPLLPRIGAQGPDAPARTFLRQAPVLLGAVAVAAGFEQAVLSLLPVYGGAYAMDESTLSALIAVLIAGSVALQVPLGLLAERLTARTVLIACAFGSALCCVGLPLSIDTLFVWPLAIVLGGLSYGIYTMGIVELGETFSGSMLVAGNAAFAIAWGVGGVAGPLATGTVMDLIGVHSFPLTVGFFCFVLGGFAIANRLRLVPQPPTRRELGGGLPPMK